MSRSIERLRKILELEEQQGFRNKSVIGGLQRLSERWGQDANQESTSPAQRALVGEIVQRLRNYQHLEAADARSQAVAELSQLTVRWTEGSADAAAEPAQAVDADAPAAEEAETALPAARREPTHTDILTTPRPTPVGSASLQASIRRLPGVGPAFTTRLNSMGIQTIGDLLWLLPRRYDDYTAMKPIHRLQMGEEVTIIANLWDLKSRRLPGRNATLVTGVLGDSSATIQATWFNPFVTRQLKLNRPYVFSGKVESYLGRLVLRNPQFEPLDRAQIHTGRLVPVYPLTKGISTHWMRKTQRQVLDSWGKRVHDHLPETTRRQAGLLSLSEALEQIHFPTSRESLAEARRRLAFDELFLIQLGVLRQRRGWKSLNGRAFAPTEGGQTAFDHALPFRYTAAQARAAEAVLADMAQSAPMSRLLQGDVGSGKTAVAANAMWLAVSNGAQAAMMAPTEILAEQHYRHLADLFGRLARNGRPVQVALFTGNLRGAERAQALAELAAGEIDIAVGTHALIQEGVQFHDLGLAIIDEQHRFGVRQRAQLRQKGEDGAEGSQPAAVPHLLVMTATPIPRTLSLTIFGDLDVSVIDEMPPGRQPIKTRWLLPGERERAYNFVRRQVQAGHQAFIVYPLVEESESIDVGAAVPEYDRLCQEIFPDLRLGLLHGRMKGDEKDATMQAMQRGDIDVLVATSVVEVGIDVPNATVMVIEDAERFGLAQLHQFRGRVGRSEHPSYCILISAATTGNAAERLHALEESQDGFALAEKDLALRGPGDFFGTRQSGLPDLKMAQLSDMRILEQARAEANRLLEEDPDLSRPEHLALARKVRQFWHGEGDVS